MFQSGRCCGLMSDARVFKDRVMCSLGMGVPCIHVLDTGIHVTELHVFPWHVRPTFAFNEPQMCMGVSFECLPGG
jgi:hypothetical protein